MGRTATSLLDEFDVLDATSPLPGAPEIVLADHPDLDELMDRIDADHRRPRRVPSTQHRVLEDELVTGAEGFPESRAIPRWAVVLFVGMVLLGGAIAALVLRDRVALLLQPWIG